MIAALVSWAGWLILQILGRTSRITFSNSRGYLELMERRQPFIYGFWHRFQLLLVYSHRFRRIVVLVSQSFDGELIARTIHRLGFLTARGSSSRGGARALVTLIRELQEARCVAFTPDGPKGPYRSVHQGLILAAQKTGAPIVPLAWAGSRVKELSSWDRFMIPKPFGRVVVCHGDPVVIPADEDRDLAAQRVQRALDDAFRKAQDELLALSKTAPC